MNKGVVTTIVLAGCRAEVWETGPGQPVAHRRVAFKKILKVFEPTGGGAAYR